MSDPLVLAIDIGTSSCRAILYDSEAAALPGLRAHRSYALRVEPPGAAELDPLEILAAAEACITETLVKAGADANRIAAVGCCAFWHSVLGVDAKGEPVTPVYTWAEQRSARACREMRATLPAKDYHRRTGCFLHPSFVLSKLRWLSHLDVRAERWLSPAEFLYEWFFGEAACSVSMASGTGLFDTLRLAWDSWALSEARITEAHLSPVAGNDFVHTGLREPYRSRWPALAEIPWIPAIGDGAASNLGSGCTDETAIALNLGTSGAVRVLWRADAFEAPDDLWVYRLDRRRPVMGAAFSDGGNLYAWAKANLALPGSDAETERALGELAPGAHGLDVLPFFAGERSLGWRLEATATLHGLSLGTSAIEILQALMEAVALRFVRAVDLLRREFPAASRLVASGGVRADSPVWAGMICDAVGMPLTILEDTEASARGAAILALERLHRFSASQPPPTAQGRTIEPRSQYAPVYRAMLERQERLYSLFAENQV